MIHPSIKIIQLLSSSDLYLEAGQVRSSSASSSSETSILSSLSLVLYFNIFSSWKNYNKKIKQKLEII